MRKAIKYYEGVATQLCTNGHCLDVFACSLDQVGAGHHTPGLLNP
jgi:protein transport protein SEC23